MKFNLKNIGIIDKADISLSGLTVITGKNSTGKSTVGKALFSIIEGGIRIPHKYEIDLNNQIRNTLYEVRIRLGNFKRIVRSHPENNEDDYPNLRKLLGVDADFYSLSNEEKLIELDQELKQFDVRKFLPEQNDKYKDLRLYKSRLSEAQDLLEHLIKLVQADPDYSGYEKMSMNDLLRKEFLDQIQPVSWKAGESEIELNEGSSFTDVKIRDNQIESLSSIGLDSLFERVVLIDDPTIINQIDQGNLHLGSMHGEIRALREHVPDHHESLSDLLQEYSDKTTLEKTQIASRNKSIMKKLDAMLAGDISSDEKGDYLVTASGAKLRLSNLATGAKTIALIKILLREGMINSKTMLILDEPESHLHPEWQNMFAEVIVLITKVLGTRILMTTHSPNFFYALDTYARKYDISDKCSFYQAECNKEGHAVITDVSNDTGRIYSDFLDYLVQMREIRNDLQKQEDRHADNQRKTDE